MYWNWKLGGLALGLSFLAAVVFVKPIGVSTQFVILDGWVASHFNSSLVYKDESSKTGYASTNAYLNKSDGKYAKAVAKPLNYGFVFVLSMILGGFLGSKFSNNKGSITQVPLVHKNRFDNNIMLRYCLAFVGGVLALWGARLAGGCTSGHMMSGIMQTSVSGYLFAVAAFVTAIPTAIILYKQVGDK